MLEAALERRPSSWLERRLSEGREGRREVYRHIARVYARPLVAYYRESPWRWVGDARSVVLGFFAERIFRRESFDRWFRRDAPLRRWLVKAFAYYLVELARERADGGVGNRLAQKLALVSGNPERAYHRALAESLVLNALGKAREECERRGLRRDWTVFFERCWKGRPSEEILRDLRADPAPAAAMIERATGRFRSALRDLFERDGLPEGGINREIRFLLAARGRTAGEEGAPAPLGRGGGLDPGPKTRERAVGGLLALGLTGFRRPVDEIVARLREDGARDWLAASLEAGPARRFGRVEEILLEGRASLTLLLQIKEESKRLYRASGPDAEARLSGLATYLIVLASAFVNRAARIAGATADELRAAWLALAPAAPEPWDDLLARAALGLSGARPSSPPPSRSVVRSPSRRGGMLPNSAP